MTAEQARAFAAAALANVTREYPRHVSHLLTGPGELLDQRELHPAFYGSYDWHSAVHMHWTLARVLRLHPGISLAGTITERLDAHLSPRSIEAELRYFAGTQTFERPYGWAWLLELQAELARLGNARWSEALRPLAEELARRMAEFVSAAPYPIRAGSHGNTAFACLLSLDYAHVACDQKLEHEIKSAAARWYRADRDAPIAYEPSLDDFLSPALMEAALMREVLPAAEFGAWLKAFLPSMELQPPQVADRSDAKQSHLDGLALSRAWCLRRLGFGPAAERQLAAGLPHAVGGHYVGSHWLASFAALALGERP
ncbi:MAG TPA: DUF2891 domain-containing protein [Burkholderiales bacterium]|nr:DUF2891 domain-containing protein [Burkholderiales bacterium]